MSTLQIINLKHPTATSNNITFSNTGDVGIGTTVPSFKFDVRGGRAQFSPSSEAFAIALRYNDSTNGVWLGSPSANSFQISSAGGNAVFNIDGNGNVGMNSGYGSVGNVYGVRAWVNYNAQANSIRSSQGVTSITKNATGDYTVNLNFTMPDINYSYIVGISSYVGGTTLGATPMFNSTIGNAEVAPTTTTFRFATCVWNNGGAGQDAKYLNIIVTR